MPTISIIVPIYNVEKYLDKCIKSILEQTFNDFELILINDGSTDKSGDICEYYKEKDKRIKVVNKENGGVSSARNAGLDIAEGKYIGFVDPDDWIDVNMYERMYKEIMTNNADIVVCDFVREYEDKINKKKLKETKYEVNIFNNIQALKQLYKVKYTYVVAWNKLYKRELFNNIRYKDGFICEDEFIIHHLLYKSVKTIYISEILYHYFQREGSIINSEYNIKRLDKIKALHERVEFFSEIKEFNLKYKAEKDYWDSMIWAYFIVKNKIKSSKNELKGLKEDFNHTIIDLLKNPLFTWKNKVFIILFWISPNLYKSTLKLI